MLSHIPIQQNSNGLIIFGTMQLFEIAVVKAIGTASAKHVRSLFLHILTVFQPNSHWKRCLKIKLFFSYTGFL